MTANARAVSLVGMLGMKPHPEGGKYVEIWRSSDAVTRDGGPRSAGTAIHFLLERGETSRWHVVDADEIWHFNEGAPLELVTFDPRSGVLARHCLALPSEDGSRPMAIVPRGVWQAARTLGDYTLVACTVSPGFEFAGFALCRDLPGVAVIASTMPEDLQGLL